MPTVSGVRKSRCRPSSMSAPSPPWPIERGDRDQPDGGDGRDADAGDDRGQRQRQLDAEQSPRRVSTPCPSAASCTSAGTPSRPVTMFRTRISSVYRVSGISAVVRERPVSGSSSANSASDGMVYSTPVIASTGP